MNIEWTMVPLLFVAGCIAGSFLSMLTFRLPRNMSMGGQSICPDCRSEIPWTHNLPLWGFLISKGRCWSCAKPISLRYPLQELACGILIVLLGLHFGWTFDFAKYSLLGLLMVAISIIDHDFRIIPDKLTMTGALLGFGWAATGGLTAAWEAFLTGFIALFAFLAIRFLGSLTFKKEALGLGDVKLAGMLGLWIGLQSVFLGFFIGFTLLMAIGWIRVWRNQDLRHQAMPLAPYLAAGIGISLVVGTDLLDWYLGFFHNHP